MIALVVKNRPNRATIPMQVLLSELGGQSQDVRVNCEYLGKRFERLYPEHTMVGLKYLGLTGCKRYARFEVEYLIDDTIP